MKLKYIQKLRFFFPYCSIFFYLSVNNPIPSNLKSEAKKAAKILREFTEITSRNGPDKIIPGR